MRFASETPIVGSNRRRFLGLVIFAGLTSISAVPVFAQNAPPSAIDILKRAAVAYREEKDYQAHVTVQWIEDNRVAQNEFSESGSGNAFRVERTAPKGLIQTCDGTTEWDYDPFGHVYAKRLANSDASWIASLAQIDQNVTQAVLDDQEQYDVDGASSKAFVIEVARSSWPSSAPSGAQSSIYTIDASTYAVRQAIIYSPSVAQAIYYSFSATPPPSRVAQFTFSPPPGTVQVSSLPEPKPEFHSIVGMPAPDFSLKDTADHTLNLGDYRGKVVVLAFVGSWCLACGAQLPYLQQVYSAHNESELFAFALDVGDSQQLALDYDTNATLSFPMLLGADPDVTKKYFVADFPTTYVIGRDGKIVFKSTGTDNPRGFLAAVDAAVAKSH